LYPKLWEFKTRMQKWSETSK